MAHNNIFNLLEFDKEFLAPALTAYSRATSRRHVAYSFANMASACLWMVVGVEAGYFSDEHAQSLFGQRFHSFFDEFEKTFALWGYLFDPEFEPLLVSSMNRRRLAQREEAVRLSKSPIVEGAFRTALLAESALVRAPETNVFLRILNFESTLLDQVVEKNYALEKIDDIVVNRDNISLGFQAVWRYMELLADLSVRLQQEDNAPAKRCDLRVRQLTRWRVNRHAGIDQPFLDMALFVNRHYAEGILSEDQIRQSVQRLLDNWGYTHLRAVGGSRH